jgi:hypothetical protein
MIIWDCVEAKRYISASIRDEISFRLQQELRDHISDCEECATELQLTRELYSLRATAPPDLLPKIKKAVRIDIIGLEQGFFVEVWPSEDDDLAGSLVLDNLSDESLNLLFEEIR